MESTNQANNSANDQEATDTLAQLKSPVKLGNSYNSFYPSVAHIFVPILQEMLIIGDACTDFIDIEKCHFQLFH